MRIILDGYKMDNKENLHLYLKQSFDLSDYYGENLDALWDELSSLNEDMEIILINANYMLNKLGEYGNMLLELFRDLAFEQENINFMSDGCF
ncbi:MAG TPA: barstar family protein [Tissierellaceae bacterium]